MNLGRVTGKIWATRKVDSFTGRRLLIVQPMNFRGRDVGTTEVMLDTVDAGEGDTVIYVSSSEASIPFPEPTPAAATIVGVVDRVDHVDGSWVPRDGSMS
ncbi:MAG: EutN/CcmL family microcompartment protein [Rhodothermales bacterium]|nr:EutN/CcmL family microcompartment protein [Rhodothermales bacterium]